ncbi:unnamed protein product [Tuber aestivum]|uniref:Uncharacterized protein n=1 Tax=Tuber aestivum TaxID=59557 RepID=A0A292PR56_9PEZI|nr:unnamed protein product [Tuber aestivum]
MFEFGYTELYKNFKVILIKLNLLEEDSEEMQMQHEFVEMCHKNQRLQLTLGEILYNEFCNIASEGWTEVDTIYLTLDPLRKSIIKATKCHLINKGVSPEPAVQVYYCDIKG